MRVLVTGGAGFIGSHFVKRLVGARRRGRRARQAHVLGQPGEPRRRRLSRASRATSATRTPSCRRPRAAMRSSTSPRRLTSTARSSTRRSSWRRTSSARTSSAESAQPARNQARPRLDGRGVRRRRRAAPVGRRRHAPPVEPVLGLEGRRRSAGARGGAHVRRRRLHHARREHATARTSIRRS